ncbi:hypothetical protein QQ045_021936 [Rhodiola kirilowii]
MATSIFASISHFAASVARKATWSNVRIVSAFPFRTSLAGLHQDATTAAGKATEGMQQGMNDAMNMGEPMKENYSTDNVTQTAKDVSGKVAGTAQDVAEKAKQTMQDAWNSTKETAQNAKDAVMGKAEESKDCIKETANQSKDYVEAAAETVERSMNTKARTD